MSDLYYAAACQTDFPCPTRRSEIGERTRRMCDVIRHTIIGYEPFFDVRLLCFPEFAHAAPIHDNAKALLEHLCVPIPNEHTQVYEELAKEYGCFIQTGSFLEVDADYPECVFNTTLLIGPTGILSKYRKVNPWIPWEVHTSPHDLGFSPENMFPVMDTELGKLGVAICYDWLFPECIRQIAHHGAEVIMRVSAYMDPWGATPPMDWWTLFNRARAAENTTFVVAANQGAQLTNYPPFSWPGGSMIVDYDGRILAQADPGPGEKVVVGPIDLETLRAERRRRVGHDMASHLRSNAYDYLTHSNLRPAPDEDHPLTIEGLRRRIKAAKS